MARVVIIGYGLAGSVFHGPLVAATDGLEVAAIVTSDAERQARARADHPGAAVLAAADDVWADPSGYDLVVVATANVAHVPLATAALAAGLPVVVDKPLAVTAAAARSLVAHARAVGGRLGVFFNRRWDDDLLTVRRLLAEGVLGDVLRFESRFERWRPEPRVGSWRESAAPEDGGGLLLDLGTHLVDQAILLFGPVRSVYAEVASRRPGTDVDDDVFVALEHAPYGTGAAGPVRSHLWMSSVAADAGPRLRVRGSRAAFAVDGLDGQEDALRAGGWPGGGGRPAAPARPPGRLTDGGGSRPVALEPGGWVDYYAEVAGALASGGPLPADPADAVRVAEVLDAARASAQGGRVVRL